MTLTVYALKSCDSCRKALADLRGAGHEPVVIDIRADGMPPEVLARLAVDPGPAIIVNRRSTTWRGLDDADRARAMDPVTSAGVLTRHPTLMKRPIIIAGETVHIGWSPALAAAFR